MLNVDFKQLNNILDNGTAEELRKFCNDNNLIIENGKITTKQSSIAALKETIEFWDKRQLVKKILLNSLYGALLNVGSRFFDARLGQSTTLTGRCIDRHMAAKVNEIITGVYDYKGQSVIYCVDGSTELVVNDTKETIAALYDRVSVNSLDEVKYITDTDIEVLTYNINTGEREYKKPTAVIKRTAVKKMYKIWIDDTKSVTVSEDHRIIVKRNGIITEATPLALLEDDVFINVKGYTQYGKYECMK